ncbi:MAG: DUF2156 domain-containing protein [Lachnospiraceae bacterium]|nr:DUF2156 domain-containing protein [Lachnospiraceae bacterium]
MIKFQEIELKDREWIDACLKEADLKGCEYSFANNFIWRKIYGPQVALVEGFYCTRNGKGKEKAYSYPAGKGDIKPVIEALVQDAKERNERFILRSIPADKAEELETLFPGMFDIQTYREDSDYIYSTEKMASLAGKKLHGKRNHIARFKDNPDWSFEEITRDNIAEVFEMNLEWCKLYEELEDESLNDELSAVKEAFDNFEELALKGGFIRREGKIVAYSIGEPLNSDTFVIHIEKAFPGIQGAYPMINQQFVQHFCMDFEYVNREEDLGDEGLRKAKLSYYPEIIYDKYTATLKEEQQ